MACVPQALPYIENYTYQTLYTWLDNDAAGERATDAFNKFAAQQGKITVKPMNQTYAPHSRLQNRLDGIMDLLIDGAITRTEFNHRREQLRERQIEVENQLAANRQGDDSFKDAMLLILDLCSQAADLFKASTNVEQKRRMLNAVFQNLALDERTLCYSYKIPFSDFVEMRKVGKWSD